MSFPTPVLAAHVQRAEARLPIPLRHPTVLQVIQQALAEDLFADGDPARLARPRFWLADVTSAATLPPDLHLRGRIFAKAEGVVAGLPVATAVAALVDPELRFTPKVEDGQTVTPGTVLAVVSGPGGALLAAERTMLNFLGRLSGIATLTRRFVEAVRGTRARILDTRKTTPGLRHLEKYAVRMGGGANHRLGLYDMALVKDNHIDAAGSLTEAVRRCREHLGPAFPLEVEVKTLDELEEALALEPPPTRILLDNMDLCTMAEAVRRTAGRVPLEASGNVCLDTVRAIAETGVDFISVGALTHSAPVLDLSLRLEPENSSG